MENRSYYKSINLIRLLFCVAVLLYHLGFLKGGYLAVCSFFVLSGYLSSLTNLKKEKFSFRTYYCNKLVKVYLPLVALVFITIFVYYFFFDIKWLNLKEETISVLLNFNNFWQIQANLDYFAGDINSPFIHFWYISILLQFDLVFPILFVGLNKIKEKVNKTLSISLLAVIVIISTLYFYMVSLSGNMMVSYYNTFARVFSLLFGVLLGFFHSWYGSLNLRVANKNKFINLMFLLYSSLLVLFYIFISSDSSFYSLGMIFVTLITCRLIDYSYVLNVDDEMSFFDKIIKALSEMSYEIYLVQYPVIFFMQYLMINKILKLFISLILIFLFAIILDYSLDLKRKNRNKILLCFFRIIIFFLVVVGIYSYFVSKDYKKEMELLEKQLEENEKLMLEKQEKFDTDFKDESNEWLLEVENLNNEENRLGEYISNLHVVGIGDSIMLGAVPNLYGQFKNGYFDAKVSRTAYSLNDILINLKNRNMLNGPIVVNLGANGDCGEQCRIKIMETCGNNDVFWVNVTNDHSVHFNDKIKNFADRYDNLYVIDWNSRSNGHSEYFAADGIHLTSIGRTEYVKTIYDNIYQVYLEKFNQKKNDILLKHEENLKNSITFYGNAVLLNTFDYMKDNFLNDKFNIDKDYNYQSLKEQVKYDLDNNILNYKVFFVFDKTLDMDIEKYIELIDMCSNYDIYIVSFDEEFSKDIDEYNYENVKIIDFYKDIDKNEEYVLVDKIHLTNEGNMALANKIKKIVQR